MSYADNCKRNLEVQVGDMVFLKVSQAKGTLRFGQ